MAILAISAATTALAASESADGWKFVPVREETATKSSVRNESGMTGLVIAGNGEEIAYGQWVKGVGLPNKPFVKFSALYRG